MRSTSRSWISSWIIPGRSCGCRAAVTASWIPYLTGGFSRDFDASGGFTDSEIRYRQTYRTLEGQISYPFSRVSRFELSAGVNNIAFSGENRFITYDVNGFPIASGTQSLAAPPGWAAPPRNCGIRRIHEGARKEEAGTRCIQR